MARNLLNSFVRKGNQKVIEFSNCTFAALYDSNTFAEDMSHALTESKAKYGNMRKVLVLDVSPNGPGAAEDWMRNVLPGQMDTHLTHIGPYLVVPNISRIFEICDEMYRWLRTEDENGTQRIVLLMAEDNNGDSYRSFSSLGLIASAYLTYTGQQRNTMFALDVFKRQARISRMVSKSRLSTETSAPSLIFYLRCFSVLLLHRKYPSSKPLIIGTVTTRGKISNGERNWCPVVKVQFGKDGAGSVEIRAKENSRGLARFEVGQLIFGDFTVVFEDEIDGRYVPLFSIAMHSQFWKSPVERVALNDCERAPNLSKEYNVDKNFALDFYLRDAPLPKGFQEWDFNDVALLEYTESFGKEVKERIVSAVDECQIALKLAAAAPLAAPPVHRAMSPKARELMSRTGGAVRSPLIATKINPEDMKIEPLRLDDSTASEFIETYLEPRSEPSVEQNRSGSQAELNRMLLWMDSLSNNTSLSYRRNSR